MRNMVQLYVDGAIGEGGRTQTKSGAAAVARTADGYFLGWLSRQLPRMTNNEAEYRGLLLGLELAGMLGARQIEITSDSQVVVWQMQGRSQVNSQRLKELHRQACHQAALFAEVRFQHVLREHNRLADALAVEAMAGRCVQMPPIGPSDWWRRLPGLWRPKEVSP